MEKTRALASGLFHVQVDNHDKLFHTTRIRADLAHCVICRVKVGKSGKVINNFEVGFCQKIALFQIFYG